MNVLPRHSFTAGLLGDLLVKLCLGFSVHSAWIALRIPLSLQGTYGLLRRARDSLGDIRCRLLKFSDPPLSRQVDPLLLSAEHIRSVFDPEKCAVGAFQHASQQALLG